MQIHAKQLINGSWRGAAGLQLDLINPTTEQTHATVRLASHEDIDAAVGAAHDARDRWARTDPHERGRWLAAIGERLAARAEALTSNFALEIGTPLAEARRLQVDTALRSFASAPTLAAALEADEMLATSRISRVPVGVAVCITPWNYPLYQIATKIVPALVGGATVILKPSEVAPLSAYELGDCALEAGLPPGVLNILIGGAAAGQQLIVHPLVEVVSFTGSTATGRLVGAACGAGPKKVALELGGKSASILLQDADMPVAIRQTLAKCLQNAGQTCAAPTRLLVPRSNLNHALQLVQAVAGEYRTGDPFDPATRMGPVINASQHNKVLSMIRDGINQGATLVCGGPMRPPNVTKGYFVTPTVLMTSRPDIRIAQEEIFGPVLTVLPYDSETEAITIANGTPYGLSGAVWSADVGRARSVAQRLRAGSISLNGAGTHPDAPFGGFGASGFGRERGLYGLETYTTTQAIHS